MSQSLLLLLIVCCVYYHDHELQFGRHEGIFRALRRLLGFVVVVFWRRDERWLVDCFFDVTEFFQLDISFLFADLQTIIDALLDKGINVSE